MRDSSANNFHHYFRSSHFSMMGPLYSFFGCSPDRHFPDRRPKIENRTNERARKGESLLVALTHTHAHSPASRRRTTDGDGNHIIAFCKIFLPFFSSPHTETTISTFVEVVVEKKILSEKTGPLDLRNRPIERFPPLLAKPMNVSAAK